MVNTETVLLMICPSKMPLSFSRHKVTKRQICRTFKCFSSYDIFHCRELKATEHSSIYVIDFLH
jgi:hypothetical protein